MLRFHAYTDGQPAREIDLSGAYAFGADDVPVRADLVAEGNEISCMKSMPGSAGLALLWRVGGNGRFLMQTTRLPERKEPYTLNVELARAQLMRLYRKREDWMLFDDPDLAEQDEEFAAVRSLFVDALSMEKEDPAKASELADEALDRGMVLGEKLTLLQADRMNEKRLGYGRPLLIGTRVNLHSYVEAARAKLSETFDILCLPMRWRGIESTEGNRDFTALDEWVDWAAASGKVIHAGPLVSFDPLQRPGWLENYRGRYDKLRKLLLDHVQRVVERYGPHVQCWIGPSGLHTPTDFGLSFDQITDLTKSTCQLLKRLAPHTNVLIEITRPWGEYYARSQRSIPPLLFAEMAFQNDYRFDGFGVRIETGAPRDGFFVRDLLRISSLLDSLSPYGKMLDVTSCLAPASVDATPDGPTEAAGMWHAPWSPRLQAEWLQAVCRVAMSKPLVRSVCWGELSDAPDQIIPAGGLCDTALEPKTAFRELRNLRQSFYRAMRSDGPPSPEAQP